MKKMKIPAIFAAFIIAASLCLTGCELLYGDSSQKSEQPQEQEEKVTYPREHSVKYYLNGGYGSRNKYEEGKKASEYFCEYLKHTDSIILEEEPYRPDYVFEGWYSDKELTKKADSTFLETETSYNVNLYAKWTLSETIRVSFYPYYEFYNMNEEDRLKEEVIEVKRGETLKLPSVQEKAGWHFKGWVVSEELHAPDTKKLRPLKKSEVTVSSVKEKYYGSWRADDFYIEITGNASDYIEKPKSYKATSFAVQSLNANPFIKGFDYWRVNYIGEPGSKKRNSLMSGLVITITDADGNEIPYTEREEKEDRKLEGDNYYTYNISIPYYDFIMPGSDVTVTVNFTTVNEDFKADTPIELPAGTDGSAGPTGKYILFGYYPQSKKDEAVKVFEKATIQRGNMTYCLGSDGYYYCRTERTGTVYNPAKGFAIEHKYEKDYWSKVEPIKWRVLDENYDHDLDRSTPGKRFLMAENSLFPAVQFSQKNPEDQNPTNEHEWYNNIYAYSYKDGELKVAVDKTFKEDAFTEEGIGKICQTKLNTKFPMTGQIFIPDIPEMQKYFKRDSDESVRSATFYLQLKEGYDLNRRPDKGSRAGGAYFYLLREHLTNEGSQTPQYLIGYQWDWDRRSEYWYSLYLEHNIVPVMCID